MKARYYQGHALKNLETNISQGKNDNLVVIPVGGGKSIVIAHNALFALRRKPGSKVILLAHRKELSSQNAEKLLACDPTLSIGFEKAEEKCTVENQVMVASVQTIGKEGIPRVREWCDPKNISAILIDEAHHIPGGKTYQVLLEELRSENPDIIITGFTATPVRGDGERIDAYIQHVAYEITMQELVDAKYLARLLGVKVKTSTSLGEFKGDKRKDFDESKLAKLVNNAERNQLALDVYLAKHKGEAALAFCVNKAHAEEVAALFIRAGVRAGCITEDTPPKERERMIREIKSGELDVLSSVAVLSEGFDCPLIKCLLMLRPTKSPVLFEQLIGRALRLIAYPNPADPEGEWLIDWETKSFATVYDFVDQESIENGAYNLARMVGLNPEFDLNGKDVFQIKSQIDVETQGEPLLAAALQSCRSPEEIEKLLSSHDLLTEIKSIHYTPNAAGLGWMSIESEKNWIQLGQGEIAKIEKNALGAYVLHMPRLDIARRHAERVAWETAHPDPKRKPWEKPEVDFLDPATHELEAETMEEALEMCSEWLNEILPWDRALLNQNASWKTSGKSEPATPGQRHMVAGLNLGISDSEIAALTKAEASDIITKAKLQKSLMEAEGRINFGKYKGVPAMLVRIHTNYIRWMLDNRADFLKKSGMLTTFEAAENGNPVHWLAGYRPRIYEKDFAGMEAFYEKSFAKDPDDVRKVIKFALDRDPTNQWPLILKRTETQSSKP